MAGVLADTITGAEQGVDTGGDASNPLSNARD